MQIRLYAGLQLFTASFSVSEYRVNQFPDLTALAVAKKLTSPTDFQGMHGQVETST
jgi:hypothetical protein